jgi:streptogramin lyase
LRLVSDFDLGGYRLLAVSKKSELLCFKGENYLVVKPGDKKLNPRPMPVESSPRPTHFLRCDDEGILWGGTMFGQTLWWMDPKTGKYENTAIICNAGGEAYDVAFHDGCAFAVTYAGGDIVRYDRKKPWDQKNNVNPNTIAYVGREKGFIRPIAGDFFGPDGKLYAGWMAAYGKYGGAVSITDPDSGETRLIENPLGEQAISGVAVDSKFVYVGTSLGGNGLPNKKGEWAKFGIVDPATKEVVFEKTFDGAYSIGIPGYDEPTHRLLLTHGGKLMLFDTKVRDFLSLPDDTPGPNSHSMTMKNGCLYYGSKNTVIKLDVRKREWTKIADAPLDANNVAVGPDGTVYFSCGADVYVIRDE